MEQKAMSIFKPTALVGAIALITGFSVTTHAADQQATNDEQNATSLDTIVVTASRTPEKVKNVPARIDVIDQKTIEQNPTLNVSDLLQKDASVYIKQNGGIGQGTILSLRGTYPSQTLLLKDGANLNTPNTLSPSYPELLDTSDLERIEILKGPSSVQYGTDAIGGVIQLISKTPEKTGTSITSVYGENNTYKVIANQNLVFDSGFYAQIRGQRMETDGTRILDTQSEGKKAGYDQKGYSTKLGYDNKDNLKTSIEVSQNQGTNDYTADYGSTNAAKRNFENRLINANAEIKIASNVTVAARYSHFTDQEHYLESSFSAYDTSRDQADLNAKWQFTDNQNILVGASTDHQQYKDAYITNGKQEVDSTGYYFQHQYKTEKLNTQVGVRVEDNEKFGTHTVGQAAARYYILPSTSIYANVGTAFRAPALSELYYYSYYNDTSRNRIYYTNGNQNLKPEESISYEFGLDHQFTDNLSGSLSLYKTNVKNLIDLSTTSPITGTYISSYENVNKANFKGGEFGLKWKQDDLFVSSQYAYVKTENKSNGLEIAYRPKETLTLTTGLENSVYGVSASLVARSHSNASNSANAVQVPGYATVDLNAYWNATQNVKLFTNIQNVGDVQYKAVYNYGSWYINGGRLATVGVTLNF
ncbi:TonB-dependent receptor plug domain-containing protein [Acinetobacter brisouii]|uniref:TonB-dependent receptor plug domain-containing protein n=1 Tax=Acinetobacter brisouii TaxID=396323 RepID=UPI00124EF832|nr:TonB-dependent receptor [Acinetobacter brisouii]